jgi:hypothetical protein
MARVRPELLNALIQQESGGNNNAVSSKGARGLAQVMPGTARDPGFGVRPLRDGSPQEQRRFANDYLGAMLDRYNGNESLALAAYNAGPGAVDKAGGIPRYSETKNYVSKILGSLNPISEAQASEKPYKPTFEEFVSMKQSGLAPASTAAKKPTFEEFVAMKQNQQDKNLKDNEGFGSGLLHQLSVGTRGLVEGASSLPGELYGMSQALPNAIAAGIESKTGFRHPFLDSGLAAPASVNTSKFGEKLSDIAGLDKPTSTDTITYPAAKAIGEYVIPSFGMAKFGNAAIRAGGAALGGNNPITSIAGIIAGKTASGIAKDVGASPNQQIAADVLGNVASGAGIGILNAAARTASRAGKSAVGAGLEGVAGRTLNRASGIESPQIIENLATGKVPTISNPIKGYTPSASEIAGNPGISTIMRQTGLDVDSLSMLGARKFDNAKSLVDYVKKAAGSEEKLNALKQAGFAKVQNIAEPMRNRNLPVSIDNVRATIEGALARHEGKKSVTDGLNYLLNDLNSLGTNPKFNAVYNFKQNLDETLRGNAFNDPVLESIKRSASALEKTKSALSDALTATEPEFKRYIKSQAKSIGRQTNIEIGNKLARTARMSNPLISNANGQEQVFPIAANKLENALNNLKILKGTSPAQQRAFKNAIEHSKLQSRSNLGMMTGSSTAQNLSVKDAIFNDIMAAGLGDNPGILGRGIKGSANLAGNLLSPVMLGKISRDNSLALSKIFTKAELDPKYAAELMKKYGLGQMNFNDKAGRAALRGLMTSETETKK